MKNIWMSYASLSNKLVLNLIITPLFTVILTFRTQIEIIQKDGSLAELSSLSPIVQSLTGTRQGDNRFYFPKEMLTDAGLFNENSQAFLSYMKNDTFIYGE